MILPHYALCVSEYVTILRSSEAKKLHKVPKTTPPWLLGLIGFQDSALKKFINIFQHIYNNENFSKPQTLYEKYVKKFSSCVFHNSRNLLGLTHYILQPNSDH